jgi:hypothetical protein
VVSTVDGNTAQLIARHAHRPALVNLIFPLHDFATGLRYVGRKGKEQILRDTLLKRDSGGRVLVVSPELRVNL